MEETWRWFGPNDPISLEDVRQTGATGIVTALHDVPASTRWTEDAIAARKALIEGAGLHWSVCESIPIHDAIKRGGAPAAPLIDAWIDTLALLGRAGVPTVCYNFMPVVDWTRTALDHPQPDGALALRFDMADFVAYDLFILGRDGEGDYPTDVTARARARFEAMNEAARAKLETTIIAGLPGGAAAQTRSSIARAIAEFDGMSTEDVRTALRDFLARIVPVAEEVGVRLAIHPDDPPRPLFGLPRVVSTADDAADILAALDSPFNGLTLCAGSYGSRADNDVAVMAERFAGRINFAHLRNVTIEVDGSFEEAPHLGGRVDMVRVIRTLHAEERRSGRIIPMRPDHGHLFSRDAATSSNPGYSYIGRLRGLAELRGIACALEAGEAA